MTRFVKERPMKGVGLLRSGIPRNGSVRQFYLLTNRRQHAKHYSNRCAPAGDTVAFIALFFAMIAYARSAR